MVLPCRSKWPLTTPFWLRFDFVFSQGHDQWPHKWKNCDLAIHKRHHNDGITTFSWESMIPCCPWCIVYGPQNVLWVIPAITLSTHISLHFLHDWVYLSLHESDQTFYPSLRTDYLFKVMPMVLLLILDCSKKLTVPIFFFPFSMSFREFYTNSLILQATFPKLWKL